MSKYNLQIEKRIYETLGVRLFQKLVFILEKIIHFIDHGRNKNYHFNLERFDYLEDYKKFIVYNASIHIRNIVYIFVYIVIRVIIGLINKCFKIHQIDYILLLLLIKDLYCIMLQRYNYLRIQQYQKFKDKIKKKNIDMYYQLYEKSLIIDNEISVEYYNLVTKLIHAIEDKKVIIFNEKEEELLDSLLDHISEDELACSI